MRVYNFCSVISPVLASLCIGVQFCRWKEDGKEKGQTTRPKRSSVGTD